MIAQQLVNARQIPIDLQPTVGPPLSDVQTKGKERKKVWHTTDDSGKFALNPRTLIRGLKTQIQKKVKFEVCQFDHSVLSTSAARSL